MQNSKNNTKPIVQENVKISGFIAELIPQRQSGLMVSQGYCTSFEKNFHYFVANINKLFKIQNIDNILIRINKNHQASIYLNNFPFQIEAMSRKNMEKGEMLYENDVIDIRNLSFSDGKIDCNPEDDEKVIWIFRIDYSFGLYFDLTGQLKKDICIREMASSWKQLYFRNFYQRIKTKVYDVLQEKGWFPFIGLGTTNYNQLYTYFEENKVEHLEQWCNNILTDDFIQNLASNWWQNQAFLNKKSVIEAGLKCFYDKIYPACISTLIPMVEGLISESFSIDKNKVLNCDNRKIINSIYQKSITKFHSLHPLTLPEEFKTYLEKFFFKTGMRKTDVDKATRHPISHGRANPESYNSRQRALQVILTLDQIYHFIH